MKVFNKKRKGSITIETAIVLPVVIMTLLFIANILNICMVNLCMQHALNNTARKISQNTYMIYRIAGEKNYREFIETAGSKEIKRSVNNEQSFDVVAEHSDVTISNIFLAICSYFNLIETMKNTPHNIFDPNYWKGLKDQSYYFNLMLKGFWCMNVDFVDLLKKIDEKNIKNVVTKQIMNDIYEENPTIIHKSEANTDSLSFVEQVFETYKTELAIPASRIKDLNVFNSKLDPAGYFTLVASYEYDNPFSFMSSESGKGGLLNRKIKMINTVTIKPFLGSNGTTFVKDSEEKVLAPTVYVPSDTSEYMRDKIRYHKQGCENLSGASMAVALSNAQKTYAGPCEACMPDPGYKDSLKLGSESGESSGSR